jgi:predicted GNAT family acetyltransferase
LSSVVDNPAKHRFEIRDGEDVVGLLEYERKGDALDLVHTEVKPELRNRGFGDELVRGALDDLRARGERVIPTCPFVAAFIRRHPEYA